MAIKVIIQAGKGKVFIEKVEVVKTGTTRIFTVRFNYESHRRVKTVGYSYAGLGKMKSVGITFEMRSCDCEELCEHKKYINEVLIYGLPDKTFWAIGDHMLARDDMCEVFIFNRVYGKVLWQQNGGNTSSLVRG